MKFLLLVVVLAHVVICGNVGLRTSGLLAPAGVTYVDGSYHAGLSAGPVAYSGSVSQPVYRSVAAAAAAPVVAVASQPIEQTAAVSPVAYAAPVTKYAAVPTVQHVPGVADIPVTRINAEAAVIQKTVDVARPAVKTQRYEVRRPAIQKQFYDIEERVIVRPAGSAVLELSEPLSRTQKGPSIIRPTGEALAVSSSAVAISPTAETALSAVPAPSSAPAALPSIEINLARSSAPTIIPSDGIARTSFSASPPAAEIARSSFVASSLGAPLPSVGIRSSFPAPAPAPAPVQSISYSAPSVGFASVPLKTVSVSGPVQTSSTSGLSSISSGVSGISPASSGLSQISISTPAPVYQEQIVKSTPAPQFSDDSVSIDNAEFSLARSSGFSRSGPQPFVVTAPPPVPVTVPSQETIFRSAVPPSSRNSLMVNYPSSIDLIPQSRFRSTSAYSEENINSEINHQNQQRLLQLFTARGEVSEVGPARFGPTANPVEAGRVRAKVFSATPAPAYAAPESERVNTRRVVVSRPIETLQEVEVSEPVTKYERVNVNQPAVVKTASQDFVRVPTSVPVYGKTLAPVAETPVAYPAGWH